MVGSRPRTLAAALMAMGLVLLAACGGSDGPSAAPASGDDPGVAHVHGLGTDPGDGTLYAATHFGVFRIPEQGTPSRIADRFQDTMGFTVVGPKHFLGSGHPDQRENRLNPLGLIESTDAGETWRDVSLSGKVDFHALEVAHGRVYGYDGSSGRLMVSQDKTTWDNRVVLPMADFAVSPQNPDVLVATTERGLAATQDGGRRFAVVAGTPPLVFVSWPSPQALYGIAISGAVLVSADGGTSWQQRGSLDGQPSAITATDENTVYAATDAGVYASKDGGRTFAIRYRISR
jgi:hypothetical protein